MPVKILTHRQAIMPLLQERTAVGSSMISEARGSRLKARARQGSRDAREWLLLKTRSMR